MAQKKYLRFIRFPFIQWDVKRMILKEHLNIQINKCIFDCILERCKDTRTIIKKENFLFQLENRIIYISISKIKSMLIANTSARD